MWLSLTNERRLTLLFSSSHVSSTFDPSNISKPSSRSRPREFSLSPGPIITPFKSAPSDDLRHGDPGQLLQGHDQSVAAYHPYCASFLFTFLSLTSIQYPVYLRVDGSDSVTDEELRRNLSFSPMQPPSRQTNCPIFYPNCPSRQHCRHRGHSPSWRPSHRPWRFLPSVRLQHNWRIRVWMRRPVWNSNTRRPLLRRLTPRLLRSCRLHPRCMPTLRPMRAISPCNRMTECKLSST